MNKLSFAFLISCLCVKVFASHPIWEMNPHHARHQINQGIMLTPGLRVEVDEVKDLDITYSGGRVPIRLYRPSFDAQLPLIILIHGGGWIAGNVETHDYISRYLCKEVQAVVLSVDYLNAPEGKFPLPLQQAEGVLAWAVENAEELRIDSDKIALVGDSAGGNLAAALALMTRDAQGPTLCFQLLVNPATDLTCGGTLHPQGDAYDILRWAVQQYLEHLQDAHHPYVSPAVAEDLSDLPEAFILLAEKDELYFDGLRYANRLAQAGNSVKTYTQPGIGHLGGLWARASERAMESMTAATEALRAAFRKS